MKVDLSSLPEDVVSLKKIIYSQVKSYEELKQETDLRNTHYAVLNSNISDLKERNALLEEQIRFFQAMLYGRKSEKATGEGKDQLGLFNEAEETTAAPLEEKPEEITIPSHTRRKSGRKPLPEELPREEVVHDLKEREKVCPCGSSLSRR